MALNKVLKVKNDKNGYKQSSMFSQKFTLLQ